MNKSFLALPRPVLACIIGEETINADIAAIKNAEYEGAPAFAVHLERLNQSFYTEDNLKRLAESTVRPVMMLHYRKPDAKPKAYTDEERTELLRMAIRCGAACTDITADTFCPSEYEFTKDEKAVDRQRRFIDEIHEMGGEMIISSHIMQSRTCEQVLEQMTEMEKRGADIIKIVTLANTEDEFLEAIRTTLELRRTMKKPFIHLCSGEFSKPLRLLEPALGSCMTFCTERYTPQYITGQPPFACMTAALRNLNWSIDDVKGE